MKAVRRRGTGSRRARSRLIFEGLASHSGNTFGSRPSRYPLTSSFTAMSVLTT